MLVPGIVFLVMGGVAFLVLDMFYTNELNNVAYGVFLTAVGLIIFGIAAIIGGFVSHRKPSSKKANADKEENAEDSTNEPVPKIRPT